MTEYETEFTKKMIAAFDRAANNFEFIGIQQAKGVSNYQSKKSSRVYKFKYALRWSEGNNSEKPDTIELFTTRKEPLMLKIQ